MPYNTFAKKKTKKSIERELAKGDRLRALNAWEMWQDKDNNFKKSSDNIHIDRLGRFGLDGSVNAMYKEKGID